MNAVLRRCLVLLILFASPAYGQETPAAAPEAAPAANIKRDDVEAVREQLTAAEQLSEEDRKQIAELLDNTLKRREKTAALRSETQRLKAEVEKAGEPVSAPDLAGPPAPAALAKLSPEELRAEVTAAEQQVSAAKARLQEQTAELERRAQRRQEIPGELAKARDSLARAEAAIAAEPAEGEPLLNSALRLYQQAHRERWQAGVEFIEQESRTYEATSRRKVAQRDAAVATLQAAEARQAAIAQAEAIAQKADAERKSREAQRAAANAHPAVKDVAQRNEQLAEQNREMVDRIAELDKQIKSAEELSKQMQARLQNLTQRAEGMQDSPVVGAMLRNQQDQLPNLTPLRQGIRQRLDKQSELRLDKYEWDTERETLQPIEQTVQQMVNDYQQSQGFELPDDVVQELRKVVEARSDLLLELSGKAEDLLQDLAELNTAEGEVVATTEELSAFISERVFWVPSASRLSMREVRYVQDFWSDLGGRLDDVRELSDAVLGDAKRRPELWLLASMSGLLLIALRRRAKRWLFKLGDEASRPYATQFLPTVKAALATLFVAAPTALLVGFLGWRLKDQGLGLPYATGQGLLFFSLGYLALNLIRHACRPGGLAAQHFDWEPKALTSLRRAARMSQWVVLPFLALAVGVESSRDEAAIDAIGRVALILALIALGVIGALLFRPSGPVAAAIASALGRVQATRLAKLAAPAVVAAALALVIASFTGLNYTAMQLTRRVLFSFAIIAVCLAIRGMLLRWLLVAYRRVAMQRAREKRQAMIDAKEQAPQENPAVEVEPVEVNLSDINQQARSLVNAGVGVALLGALLVAWGDVLPALGYLDDFALWPGTFTTPEGETVWVTLGDVLLAMAALVLTWFAGRNLPSLLEFSLFQKLPLDAGARYAASTVTRYVITVFGFLLGMRLLGVGWSSVQWLVAAMTVGLGFGLQEIFANFVSGIIMLFERPVRPGDIVTIGDVSGIVTKIRIRATTVQDWDNKELIVPNREFITGNLINWTLSSRMLRAVIKVGVAYGSDTRLVCRLLSEIAANEPRVLDEPAPLVLFDSFGDSTLNFELRVFSDISNLLQLKHDLHLAVDDMFREHNVEIAFPQHDLHLRSLPPAMATAFSANGASKSPEETALDEARG